MKETMVRLTRDQLLALKALLHWILGQSGSEPGYDTYELLLARITHVIELRDKLDTWEES